MGDRAQAILFYGIGYEVDSLCLYPKRSGLDSEVEIGLSPKEWEEVYLEVCGIMRPEGYATASVYVREQYLDKKDEVLREAACHVGSHGDCYGRIRWYVSLEASVQDTWQEEVSSPVHLTMELSEEEADQKIRKFCELLGLPYSKPAWTLVAYLG